MTKLDWLVLAFFVCMVFLVLCNNFDLKAKWGSFRAGSRIELQPKNNSGQTDGPYLAASKRICTQGVKQPECYSGGFPAPTFDWRCDDRRQDRPEYRFILQVDDNPDFSSPEIEIGPVATQENGFELTRNGLEFNNEYVWRIKIKSPLGDWSSWAREEDSFITSPKCD